MRFITSTILTLVLLVSTNILNGQLLGRIDLTNHQYYSYCPDENNAKACFSSLLSQSEYIFEGTCIRSRFIDGSDGNFYVESTYEIHKNFKKEIDSRYVKLYAEATRPNKYNEKGEGVFSAQPDRYYRVLTKVGTTGIIVAENTSIRPKGKGRSKDTFLQEVFILKYHLLQDTPEALLNRNEIAFVQTQARNFYKFSSTDQIYETILKTPDTQLLNLTNLNFKKKN